MRHSTVSIARNVKKSLEYWT